MTRIPTILFLIGTVTVACNGAIIKGKPCDHQRDEEIKTDEPFLISIPEAPMLPPLSSNALEFVAPVQDEMKIEIPEATTSLPSVPLSYEPATIVSGDYAWPSASLYPNYPVSVLTGQAALDYPNVQIVPMTDTIKIPEYLHKKEENSAAISMSPVLPSFEPGMVWNYSQLEKKELAATPESSIGAAPFLPPWASIAPYQLQQPWNYYPIAPRPCEHTGSSPDVAVKHQSAPVILPFYAPALAPESEIKPVSLPEAPVLPPFSMPELPLAHAVAYDETPANEFEKFESTVPMVIPEAPILPPFVAPELPKAEEIAPIKVAEWEMPALPHKDEVVLESETPCEKQEAILPIPEAPVLPAFVAPELHLSVSTTEAAIEEVIQVTEARPLYVSIPEAPVLPAFVMPELHLSAEPEAPTKEENCEEAVTESAPVFVIIPEAPVLPPFIAPETPVVPIYEEPKPEPAAPCEEQKEVEYENIVPFFIPTAPVLPPFVAPEIPIIEEKVHLHLSTEAPKVEEVLCEEPESQPEPLIPIPAAPLLPAFVAPEMPALPMYEEPKSEAPKVEEILCEEPKSEPEPLIPIPAAPLLPTFVAPEMPALPMYEETKPEAPKVEEILCEEPVSEPEPLISIPAAPLLPAFIAPEMPALPMYEEPKSEAPKVEEILCEEPESEHEPLIPIPAAPLLPTFVAPEMPALPMYEEHKSEDCDKDKEYKPAEVTYPYYLPIPASYALSSKYEAALPESAESIAECLRKILGSRLSPAFYSGLTPEAQGIRAPIVPMKSPFYYYPAMNNALPVY